MCLHGGCSATPLKYRVRSIKESNQMTPANLSHVNVELDSRSYLAKKPNLQSEQESTATEEDIRYESVIW